MSEDSSRRPVQPPQNSLEGKPQASRFSQPIKPKKTSYGPVAAVLVTIAVYFASQIIVGVLLSLGAVLFGVTEQELTDALDTSVPLRFLLVAAVATISLFFIWKFLVWRSVALRDIGMVRPHLRDVGMSIYGYLAYFAVLVVTSILVNIFLPGVDMNQQQEIGFSRDATGYALIYIFASLVIIPPVTEEIITRGFLYTGLKNKLPKLVAAVITSLIFAGAHLQFGSGNALLWVAAIDTFLLSMILVYLRDKSGSLWSPILVHGTKNAVAFTGLFIL